MIDIKKFCDDMLKDCENIYIHHETVYATNLNIMIVCNKKFITDDMQRLSKTNPPEAWRNLYLDLPQTDFEPVSINEIEDILKGITPNKYPVYKEVECPCCSGKGRIDCGCGD